jgi:hypothetical protein
MPFCPQCEAEYEAGVQTCTDCRAALVDVLPPPAEEPDVEDGEPVSLRQFSNAAEAKMVEGLLNENGIRAFVSGGDFTVAPTGFAGEIVLMVDERDLDRATALYEAYFGGEAAAEMPPAEESENGDQA